MSRRNGGSLDNPKVCKNTRVDCLVLISFGLPTHVQQFQQVYSNFKFLLLNECTGVECMATVTLRTLSISCTLTKGLATRCPCNSGIDDSRNCRSRIWTKEESRNFPMTLDKTVLRRGSSVAYVPMEERIRLVGFNETTHFKNMGCSCTRRSR